MKSEDQIRARIATLRLLAADGEDDSVVTKVSVMAAADALTWALGEEFDPRWSMMRGLDRADAQVAGES